MDSKKGYKFILLKKYILIFVLLISVGFCITFIPNIEKDEVITLSATSNQAQNENQNNIPAEQKPQISKPAPVVQAPVAQRQITSSVNSVTQAAVKLGILSCVSRINQVASFLTANNKTGVFIFTPQNPPDQHVFSTSFELIRSDNSTLYASANFFPNQDAVYDTVEYVEKNCEEVEKTIFPNLKRISVMKQNIIVLDAGTVKVFLMPAGSGTVVIKKEVIQ